MKTKLLLILLGLGCSACAMSPEPDYFTLVSVEGPVSPVLKDSLEVQRPLLARYLDRLEFVGQTADVQIEIDNSRFWAEPLDTMIERILAEDLRQRLPSSSVESEFAGITVRPREKVTLDLEHFNRIEPDRVVLEGRVTLHGQGVNDRDLTLPIKLEKSADDGGADVTEALSALLGQLADKIVEGIKTKEL